MSLRIRLNLERLEERETPSPIGPTSTDPNSTSGTTPPPTPDTTQTAPAQTQPPTGGPTYF
jgi:hypothetical protein